MNLKYPFTILLTLLLCSGVAGAMEPHIKAHIDARKQQPGSRLFFVIQSNQIKDARKLFNGNNELDINANYVGRGFNPLQHAVEEGHAQMVQFLIECGANVNYQDAGGCTLTHYKPKKNAGKVMKVLIGAGACIDIKNNKGRTPYECNALLLDKHFYQPFEQAVKSGDVKKVLRFVRQGDSAHFRGQLTNFLDSAVQLDDPTAARLLLRYGASLGQKKGKISPFALCNGDIAMLKALITAPQRRWLPGPGKDWQLLHDRLFALMCCIKRHFGNILFPKDMRKMLCQYVINADENGRPSIAIAQEKKTFLLCVKRHRFHISKDIKKIICAHLSEKKKYSTGTLCHAARYRLLGCEQWTHGLEQLSDCHIAKISGVLGDLNTCKDTKPESLRKKKWKEEALTLLDGDQRVLRSNFGIEIKKGYHRML